MEKSQKAVIIEDIKARAENASLAVLTEFQGMTVEESTNVRVALRNAGGEYHVVKNTLARIALTGGKHAVITDQLHNNTAVVLGFDDPVAVAKALVELASKSKVLKVKVGSLDGKPMDAAQIDALSKLPGREQMLAQALATMNAVPTNFVSLFANMIRGLLYALKAIEEKKGEAA